MSDKELLEFAAKAVALPECGWMGPAFMYVKDNTFTDWNPLTDDGDALRLAVKLNMSICRPVEGDSLPHYGTYAISHSQKIDVKEIDKGDPYAATRRAIVRAAAEVGKAMP
jgi:hypothetical protein